MIRPRLLLALTMLAAAALAPLGSPATAAPGGTVEATVLLRDLTLPAGGPTLDEYLAVSLTSGRAGWASTVTLSVDTSAATTVADVSVTPVDSETTCTTTGPVVGCTAPGPHRVAEVPAGGTFSTHISAAVRISLAAKPGAAAGDAGAITVAARADDGPTTTETYRVRVGEGVNLTAIDAQPRPVAPGGSAALRPQVRNSGPRDVHGLALLVTDEGALADTDFGNCTYADDVVVCAFDTTLAAGRTYQVATPFTVQVPRDAAAGSETGTNVQWLTQAEWADWRDSWPGTPGTGPGLELAEVASAAAAAEVPQADTDGDDNGTVTTLTVAGGQRADIVAEGASITGVRGEAHTIAVGLINRGPATLHYPPFRNNVPLVHVALPPGFSARQADPRCTALFADDPAGPPPSTAAGVSFDFPPPEYLCAPKSVRLRPGQRLSFTFTMTAGRGAGQGRGSVDLSLLDGEGVIDRDSGDNTAPITVSFDGEGGGLPITGSTPAAVASGGALLLLLGAAVVMALRRRLPD